MECPTNCLYETDYSVYTTRPASRRSWRIGQTQPVQVVFMAYRNTLQADALKLVAKKLQSSLAVEGELPEDSLDAYGDDGDDLMLALDGEGARRGRGRRRLGRVGLRPGPAGRGGRRGAAGRRRVACARAGGGGRSSRAQRLRTTGVRTPASRIGRSSRGRSSWPGSQGRRSAETGTKLRRSPSSSGRSTGSARGNWPARCSPSRTMSGRSGGAT